MQQGGVSFELVSFETISSSETSAMVNMTINMKSDGSIGGTDQKEVSHTAEDGEWKIEKEANIYRLNFAFSVS